MIGRGYSEWRGRTVTRMQAPGRHLFDTRIADDIFPVMRETVAAHLERGHTVAIASSQTRFQVELAAASLGIEHVLCTTLSVRHGKLTGKSDGPIVFGRHKARVVRVVAAECCLGLAACFFYAAGDEDEAVMHPVGRPRPVNPKPQRAIAGNLSRRDRGAVAKQELQKFPILALASRFMHIAFINRGSSCAALDTLKPATELLLLGIFMLVGPEGRRATGKGIGGFRKNAFRMAMDAGMPVVPIVIRNVDDIGARGAAFMRPPAIDLAVLPPVSTARCIPDDMPARTQAVRQQFGDTLAHWPGTAPN